MIKLQRDILKEILQLSIAGNNLSKTAQFEADVQANLSRRNLELIRKRNKKSNSGSF